MIFAREINFQKENQMKTKIIILISAIVMTGYMSSGFTADCITYIEGGVSYTICW